MMVPDPQPCHARVRGEALGELPKDLYIPPDALEVFLETFEGPLDLLLYLIRRADLDILDIPMAALTVQYLEYVESMRAANLELAAEYLLMAAMLLEIKSRMLLPRPPGIEREEADPRAELVRRLLEYERIKQAAARLEAAPVLGRDFERAGAWIAAPALVRAPEVSLNDLQFAWLAVVRRARVRQPHLIRREELSVRSHMSLILRQLEPGHYREFAALFDPVSGPVLVVGLLAALELVKEKLVELVQREALAPIYLRLAQGAGDDA
ncbi:MAG: ScpA family protein [Rhodocyclaceae bacterium]